MATDAGVAEIGVFGGSGFYSLSTTSARSRSTPRRAAVGLVLPGRGRRAAGGLPAAARPAATIPPHRINYRANVWAMRSLGVKAVISPCAAVLQLPVKPGDFVVCDQFVDRT